ncbi:MAG: dynamin family protein, partial [Desulfovibrio sp.]|nr:dynamin family protein [Desulfovibrio sp.]
MPEPGGPQIMPDPQSHPGHPGPPDAPASPLLEARYLQIKERLTARFTALHALAVEAGPEAARSVAADAIASVHAPFLFVVVGEVKAGKSSLVNALLGADICAVAPEPCT